MFATKEAVIAKDHQPGLDVHVFMMDMRAFSKGYLGYFDRARERYGVHYHRSRVSALYEGARTNDIFLRYMDESGEMQDERFDLVVLSIGMEISESVRDLGRRLGVELDEYGFCQGLNCPAVSETGGNRVKPGWSAVRGRHADRQS